MKPGWWIGILALAGAVICAAVERFTGFLGVTLGLVAGMVIGLAVYWRLRGKGS